MFTKIEFQQNHLSCQYTNQLNLLRFKKYQIEDYMEFSQSGSFYMDDQYFSYVNLTSVTILYSVINSYFQPVVRKRLQQTEILCPFNYQPVYIITSENNLQLYCQKLPKQCLYLRLNHLRYQCVYCKEGYSLIDHNCVKCPQKCSSCNSSKCTSCINNYYISFDGSCRLCDISNCQVCYEYQDNKISLNDELLYQKSTALCALCDQGFQFNYNTNTCQQIQSNNCHLSVFNDRQVCLVDNNHNLNTLSISCLQKECRECYKNQCLRCHSGYYLDKVLCKTCQSLKLVFLKSDNVIECYRIDLVNNQHKKQIIQHILFYHQKPLIDQSLFLIQIDGCLADQIFYDMSDCQPINNEYTDHQLDNCEKYTPSTTGKPYCIKIQSQLNNFVINRVTGLVTYCAGYKSCSIIVNYYLQMHQYVAGYLYNEIHFDSILSFIDALNYVVLQKEQVEEINIIYNSKAADLFVQVQKSTIPVNLIITNQYYDRRVEMHYIRIHNVNKLIIDFVLGIQGNSIQCYSLTLGLFDSIEQGCKFQQCINTFINSTIVHIGNISITHDYDKLIVFYYFGQESIDLERILINHDCLNSVYFRLKTNLDIHIHIQNLLILNSNLTNCTLLYMVTHLHLTIQNLTIKNSIISSTFLINCYSLNINYILITDTRFYSTGIFFTYNVLNFTDQFKIINCEFTDARIIQGRLATMINQIQLIHCFFIDTQIIFSEGINIDINDIKLVELISVTKNVNQALIQINTNTTTINDLYNYLYEGNSTVLSINSQFINLTQFHVKNQFHPYNIGQLNDQCLIKAIDKEYNIFLIIIDYMSLMFTNSTFLNVYTTKQMIRIGSALPSSATLSNLTFQNISTFSLVLFEIQTRNCYLNSLLFIDIWTHNINPNEQPAFHVFQVLSVRIFAQYLYFIRIKNINIKQFFWLNLKSEIVDLKNLIFRSQSMPISNYIIHDSDKSQQIQYLDNSSGDFSLIQINAINITIEELVIRNLTNTLNYLIQVSSNQPIHFLKLRNVKIYDQKSFCKGFIQVNSIIISGIIQNVSIKQIHVISFIFDINKISNQIRFTDSSISLSFNGGLINCSLQSESSELIIENLKLRQLRNHDEQYFPYNKNFQSTYSTGIIYLQFRQIFLKNIVVNKMVGDFLSISHSVNVTLLDILIRNGQIIDTLIQIRAMQGLYFKVSRLEIKGYRIHHQLRYGIFRQQEIHPQQCWSGSFAVFQNSTEFLTIKPISLLNVIFDREQAYQLSFDNIRIQNNHNLQMLLKFENFNPTVIRNLSILQNTCEDVCINYQNRHNDKVTDSVNCNQNAIHYISSQFILNTGILFDHESSNISFIKSTLFHNDKILRDINETSQIDLNDTFMINSLPIKYFLQTDNNQSEYQFNRPYMVLSFDNGSTQYPTINNTVVFNNKYYKQFKYCNFPTGQSLGDYQRLNFQQLQYTQYIKQMKFIIRGQESVDQLCQLKFLNTSLDFHLSNQDWRSFKIIHDPKNKSLIQMSITCEQHHLKYYIQILNCQLGEVLINNECQKCSKNEFSVRLNSFRCQFINDYIDETQSGLIKLKQGYWRPHFTNDLITQCQRLENCLGGWNVGDKMCKSGYIGAVCQECDLYSIRGDGKYSKQQPNECLPCYQSYYAYFQLGLIIILHLTLLYSAQISWIINNSKIRNLKLFKKKYFLRFYRFELGNKIIIQINFRIWLKSVLTLFKYS